MELKSLWENMKVKDKNKSRVWGRKIQYVRFHYWHLPCKLYRKLYNGYMVSIQTRDIERRKTETCKNKLIKQIDYTL